MPRRKPNPATEPPLTSEPASPDVRTAAVSDSSPMPAVNQAELFSPDAYPLRPDLVVMVKAKSFIHNGKLVTKDEELCRGVCADLLLGASDRLIARKWRISRSSIIGIEAAMRERGELEPLKQAISGLLGDCIVLGLRNYKDALVANTINAGQLPIPMAALIDKKGQLDGNVIPGTSLPAPELSAADIEREVLEMKALVVTEVRTVEKESVGQPTKPA